MSLIVIESAGPESNGRRRRLGSACIAAALLVLSASLLGGCAAIKRAREAQDPNKTPPGERTVTAEEAGLSAGSELSLDRAVEIGLTYQPSMVLARQDLAIAVSQAKDAVSGYLPNVTTSGKYNRTTENYAPRSSGASVPGAAKITTPPPSNDSVDYYNVNLNLDVLLLDFGRTHASVRQAAANKRAAEQRLRSARDDVTFQVQQAYYQLSKSQALLDVTRDNEREFSVHLDQVKTLFEVGRRIAYDVTKAEVDLSNAQLSVISAENDVKTARSSLAKSMGLAEDPGFVVSEPPVEEFDMSFDDLMKKTMENNPGLAALKDEEEAASAGIDYSISDLAPRISAGGGYTWSGNDFPLVWNWAFGPTLTLDLFSGFRKINGIDQATARLREARARRASYEQQLYYDLSQAQAQLEDSKKRMTLADQTVTQAQDNLDLVNELFKVGRASSVDMTDAEVALSKARSDQVQARYDYLSAVAGIKHIIGGEEK